jgi:hypothetical protein
MSATNNVDEEDLWACKCGDGRTIKFSVAKLVEYSGYVTLYIVTMYLL